MELQYHGAHCIRITTKKSVILIDPMSDITNLKTDLKKVQTVLVTRDSLAPPTTDELFVVHSPGEYEFEDYSVVGIAAQAHTESTGDKSATIYKIIAYDTTLLVIGHVGAKLSEEQLELIGVVDVVVVPVGGNGYTLDAVEAASVVRAIEPKVVIPVHSSDDGLKYDIAQDSLELFTKELSAPVAEGVDEKLKLKALPEQMTIQLLKRS